MWVALFELHATYTDALTMLGFPGAAAKDGAGLVSWSDRHGFGGVKMLADALERLDDRPFSSPALQLESPRAIELDAAGASVLEVGGSALDFAEANKNAVVRLGNVRDPALCAGLGQVALERQLNLSLTWSYRGWCSRMDVSFDQGTLDIVSVPDEQHGHGNDEIVITPEDSSAEVARETTQPDMRRLSSTQLALRAHTSMIDGVDVDDVAWGQVVRIARQILIPESTLSRNTGAGVGADED